MRGDVEQTSPFSFASSIPSPHIHAFTYVIHSKGLVYRNDVTYAGHQILKTVVACASARKVFLQ